MNSVLDQLEEMTMETPKQPAGQQPGNVTHIMSDLDLTPGGVPQPANPGIDLTTSVDGVTEEKAAAINHDKLSQVSDEKINAWFEELNEVRDAREALNERVKRVKLEAKELGILGAAIEAAFKRLHMDPDKREKLDAGFARLAKSQGVGYQSELFA